MIMSNFKEEKRIAIKKYVKEMFDLYAPDYLKALSKDEINHILEIGESILLTKFKIGPYGGSFVHSILNNDLLRTHSSADLTIEKAIPFYCNVILTTYDVPS